MYINGFQNHLIYETEQNDRFQSGFVLTFFGKTQNDIKRFHLDGQTWLMSLLVSLPSNHIVP